MKNEATGKYTDSGVIDATTIKDVLVRLSTAAKDKLGIQREKPGYLLVELEIDGAMPAYGDVAGIPAKVYKGFKERSAIIGKIRALLPLVDSLRDALADSLVYYENAREGDIARMVKYILEAVDKEGQQDLLRVFQRTLAYYSQYADRAAATRRKNLEQARAEQVKAKEPKPPEPKPEEAASPSEAKPA
jgi:hypothetical protein